MAVRASKHDSRTTLCGTCSYDLRHLDTSGQCPECGYPIQQSIALAGRKRTKPLRRFWLVISALLSAYGACLLIQFHLRLRALGLLQVPLNGHGMPSEVRLGLEILNIAGGTLVCVLALSLALTLAAAVKRDWRGVVIAILLAIAAACLFLRSASWGLVLAGV